MRYLSYLLIVLLIAPRMTGARMITENFTKVELGSIGKIFISQGDSNSIEINTSGRKEDIETSIKNGKLEINSNTDADYHITMVTIEGLSVSGSGEITGMNNITGDRLRLEVSGSGKMTLALNVKDLDIDISGVGKLTLSGSAENTNVSISGSGKVEGFDLRVTNCKADISGVGKCNLDVTGSLVSDISGIGTVNYKNKPANIKTDLSGIGKLRDLDPELSSGKNDTTKITVGDAKILIVRNDSVVEARKSKSQKSSPIWSGLEIGFNSFVDKDNEQEIPAGYDFLELNTGKSVSFSLNLLQKDFRFGKSNFWFTTGLGLTWNNYRFTRNVNLVQGNDSIAGAFDTTSTRNYSKSKLTVTYLTAPLMFEIFSNKKIKKAVHFGAGLMLGYKIGSHTKAKYSEDGVTVKPKEYDDFYLNPFRYGVRVALGYRKFNLFADYYPSTLFKENKGPELYAVNVGITLVAF